MISGRWLPALVWGVGPIATLLLSAGYAQFRANDRPGTFFVATKSLSARERASLESAPALAVANATWAFGTVDSVKKMVRTELDRLPESEGPARSRVFLRLGIVDRNPDGQAAVFAAACAADPRICNQMREALERETQARLVAPGNRLPLFFVGEHPPIPGRN
jgi:hypothetical protein